MAPVDREKEIAIGTVTAFLVWFVIGTGGLEPIIVKLVKHYKTLFQIIQQKYILFIGSTKMCYKLGGNI